MHMPRLVEWALCLGLGAGVLAVVFAGAMFVGVLFMVNRGAAI